MNNEVMEVLLFSTWKQSTVSNILITPIYQGLVSQSLENFINYPTNQSKLRNDISTFGFKRLI